MPSRTTLDFVPTDTLFCRDQRPLAAGSGYGRGANWPLPTVLHSAVRTALLREATERGHLAPEKSVIPTSKQPGFMRGGKPHGSFGSPLFNWLNIHGPFPVQEKTVYFPRPLDLVPSKKDGNKTVTKLLQVIPQQGSSNLPSPLTHVVANCETPSKDKLPDWISHDTFSNYLLGKNDLLLEELHLWDTEHRIGVELDDSTETAKEGQLYAAEHLRLREGIGLRFSCNQPPSHKNPPAEENNLQPTDLANSLLQLGGEARFGQVQAGNDLVLPSVKITGCLVKWVLLTPAIFINGWLPGWIGEKGEILLKTVDKTQRNTFRRNRRNGTGEHNAGANGSTIAAKLIAACIGKPQIVGGWDLLGDEKNGTPKATQLAVPSGSVYYFQADSPEDAKTLADALQDRCRSDFYGEKGLGLGVCGVWNECPKNQ